MPDFRLVEVLAADHAAETTAALEATARRLEHATATPGAFGTPAAARLFASLAAWRPGRDETAAHDFVGGPAEIGGAGDGVPRWRAGQQKRFPIFCFIMISFIQIIYCMTKLFFVLYNRQHVQ